MPVLGFAILLAVIINAQVAAQRLGFTWLAIGLRPDGRPPGHGPQAGAEGGGGPVSDLRGRRAGTHPRAAALHLRRRRAAADGAAGHRRGARHRGLLRRPGAQRGRPAQPGLRVPLPEPGHRADRASRAPSRATPSRCTWSRSPPPATGRCRPRSRTSARSPPRTARRCCTTRWRSWSGSTRSTANGARACSGRAAAARRSSCRSTRCTARSASPRPAVRCSRASPPAPTAGTWTPRRCGPGRRRTSASTCPAGCCPSATGTAARARARCAAPRSRPRCAPSSSST